MHSVPTILVVGDEDVCLKLSGPFPSSICNVIRADTIGQVLDRVSNASIVVIDGNLPEGPMVLCRRLRSDSVSAHIPLVLRVYQGQNLPQAITDASIPANDFEKLTQTIRRLVPDLYSPTPMGLDTSFSDDLDDDRLFDDKSMMVVYRRPEDAAEMWPPPPPVFEEGQDLVEFALSFSGFMSSIIEALEDTSNLSPDEFLRLDDISSQTPEEAEKCLDTIQRGINGALMDKDLERMKVLSSAKNRLYEKLQRLRSLLHSIEDVRAKVRDQTPSALPISTPPPRRPLTRSEELLPLASDLQKKSELTLAAEAKEKANREAARRIRPPTAERGIIGGSARRRPMVLPDLRILWISVAIMIIVGSGIWITIVILKKPPQTIHTKPKNSPPEMVMVKLRQTLAGIYVQTKARDYEKDRLSFKFYWYINGQRVKGIQTARLAPSKYREGDSVHVEVYPSDGTSVGSAMRSREIMIKNLRAKASP